MDQRRLCEIYQLEPCNARYGEVLTFHEIHEAAESSFASNISFLTITDGRQGCVAMTTGIFAGLWDVLPCTNREKYICKHWAVGASVTTAPTTLNPKKCAAGWTHLQYINYCYKVHPHTVWKDNSHFTMEI